MDILARQKGRKVEQISKVAGSHICIVDNLSEDLLVKRLRSVFYPFGKVMDIFVSLASCKGREGCNGFLLFGERRLAMKAVETLHGSSL